MNEQLYSTEDEQLEQSSQKFPMSWKKFLLIFMVPALIGAGLFCFMYFSKIKNSKTVFVQAVGKYMKIQAEINSQLEKTLNEDAAFVPIGNEIPAPYVLSAEDSQDSQELSGNANGSAQGFIGNVQSENLVPGNQLQNNVPSREDKNIPAQKIGEQEEDNPNEGIMNDEEIIAKSIASFWETDPMNNVIDAAEKNKEDLENIEKAIAIVKRLADETGASKGEVAVFSLDEKEMLASLKDYYLSIGDFLVQLSVYKDFEKQQLDAIDPEEMAAYGNDIMAFYSQTFGKSDQEKFLYLESNQNKLLEIYQKHVQSLEQKIEKLKAIPVPEETKDKEMMEDILAKRIAFYEASLDSELINVNNTKNIVQSYEGSQENLPINLQTDNEFQKVEDALETVTEACSKFKTESRMTKMFEDISQKDKEIKDGLVKIKNDYDLEGSDKIVYLEELKDKFITKEKGKYATEVEEFVQDLGDEMSSFSVASADVTITSDLPRVPYMMFSAKPLEEKCGKTIYFLKDPSGKVINQEYAQQNEEVEYGVLAGNKQYYVIKNLEPGVWKHFVQVAQRCEVDFDVIEVEKKK